MGNLRDLVYDYYFDSRDGAERTLNTQGAQVMMQLLTGILKIQPLAQKMGIKNIMEAMNVVIRMSGAPWNFQFDAPVGGDDTMQPEQDPQMQQLMQAMQALGAQVQRIDQVMSQQLHIPPGMLASPAAAGPQPAPGSAPPPAAASPPHPAGPHKPGNRPPLPVAAPGGQSPLPQGPPSPITTLTEPPQAAAA